MKKRIILHILVWFVFVALPGWSYATPRCVDIMGAIEDVKNKKKDIPSMIEELKSIVFHPQSTQAERELAIKFLTTISDKREVYFQEIFLILSDALLKEGSKGLDSQELILKSLAMITFKVTNRDVAYQAIDKWNEIIMKLEDPLFGSLTDYSFKLSEKYPEKFLFIFDNLVKILAKEREKGSLLFRNHKQTYVLDSVRVILKFSEKNQKEIVEFLQNNRNDIRHPETVREIYFTIYGEIANNRLLQIL